LPFRRLCIFPSESHWALDFDWTCSSRSAGKTVGLVHMIGHAATCSLTVTVTLQSGAMLPFCVRVLAHATEF